MFKDSFTTEIVYRNWIYLNTQLYKKGDLHPNLRKFFDSKEEEIQFLDSIFAVEDEKDKLNNYLSHYKNSNVDVELINVAESGGDWKEYWSWYIYPLGPIEKSKNVDSCDTLLQAFIRNNDWDNDLL